MAPTPTLPAQHVPSPAVAPVMSVPSESTTSRFLKSWTHTPKVVGDRMFARRCIRPETVISETKGQMKKELGAFDLFFLSVGCMVGAGVFVLTGIVAASTAGPAVVVSYVIAAVAAMLAALCYCELAVELRLAGGAFSYALFIFGEFAAFLTAANMLLEYVLASASVARAFSGYFSNLCGQDTEFFTISSGGLELEPAALILVALVTVCLVLSTRWTSVINGVVTFFLILTIFFTAITGFTQADASNWDDFLPYGVPGIFQGAALVFFAFIGFDAVATTAEEVKRPKRDLPLGIISGVVLVAVLYFMMAASLTLMLPFTQVDDAAGFSDAFRQLSMNWATYIVAAGACAGLATTCVVCLMGGARTMTVVAREGLLPSICARIHTKFGTPWITTLFLGVITAAIAFLTDFEVLANMVSIGTLFVFWVVSLALLWNRYFDAKGPRSAGLWPGFLLLAITGNAVVFGAVFQRYGGTALWISACVCLPIWVLLTFLLHTTCKQVHAPVNFGVPLSPWLPSLSILLTIFLMAALDPDAYIRFAIWTGVVTLIYVVFSVHNSKIKEENRQALAATKGEVFDEDANATSADIEALRQAHPELNHLHGNVDPIGIKAIV